MSGIAVIGFAGRFPGAPDTATLWRNVVDGVESLTRFTDDPDPDPRYVPVAGVLDDVDRFDAELFGYSPRDAQLLDPQHRHFLEVVWAALESSGYDPLGCTVPVGVFAGAKLNSYLLENLLPHRETFDQLGLLGAVVGNDKDFLATAVSYRLGLTGPSISVQTACSTSLVATHLACQSLLSGECDITVAGGSAIAVPHRAGYRYHEGGIFSPDGACRAFAADAAGTVPGSGVAAVVLRRLDDAIADGDPIRAVILGTAVNNDGRRKVGFTAPGLDGQTSVIAEALAVAGVSADTIGYVEAHGTGTPLGDPIEVAALTAAFRADSARTGYCGLGSIKPNIGHLDAAAGVTGLVKAAMAVETGIMPPSLHASVPNPAARLDQSPFFIPDRPTAWRTAGPRRAGVSSFGIGGTNAHVVIEQPPDTPPAPVRREPEVVVVSARTAEGLERARQRLAGALSTGRVALADAAVTLQSGRTVFAHRVAVAAPDAPSAARALSGAHQAQPAGDRPRVAFLFPGQGAQRPGAGAELYRDEPVYRAAVDRAALALAPHLGLDLRDLLLADPTDAEAAATLTRTRFAQPALFTVGWALAELWEHWGARPDAMIGHSVGEYVAAARAGVFDLDDALRIVARRGAVMDALPPGAMLAALCHPDKVTDLVDGGVCLAAVNAPEVCVLSGPEPALAAAAAALADRGIRTRPVTTSHAFHSAMMDPAVEELRGELERVPLRAPATRYVSSRTGGWITAEQATDPGYWAAQLRDPVLFAHGLATLTAGTASGWCVELGPGQTLTGLARLQLPEGWSVRPALGKAGDRIATLDAAGAAWCAGVDVDWDAVRQGRPGRRVELPAYPFARDRHWIDPPHTTPKTEARVEAATAGGAERVRQIWCEVLGTASAQPDDDFYALGGHSLLGAQLLARLRTALGVDLALEDVLNASTLGGLTEVVLAAAPAPTASTLPTAFPRARRDPDGMPLTAPQRRMWVLERLNPGTATHHMPFAVRLRGALDVAALERALSAVVARHEALRMRFVAVGGEARQVPEPPAPVRLAIVEPGGLQDEITRPFDLEHGPPVRFSLERHGPRDHLLVVTAHHLVLDGWSVGVLVDELARCYADPAAPLGADPVQVTDAAAHPVPDDGGYWGEALSTFDGALDLGSIDGAGGRVVTRVDAATVDPVRSQLYPALLAAAGATVGRRYGARRIVVGCPVANRHHPELEGTVGLLATTLPLPVDLGGGPGLVDRLTRTVHSALSHPSVPLERLAAGRDLIPMLLVLQNAPLPELRLGELELSVADVYTRTAKFPLSFDATPLPDGGLRLSLEYAVEVCDEPDAERLLAGFVRALTALAADPTLAAGDLPVLDEREARQVAEAATGGPAYPERTVTDLVDDQVAATPDSLALVDGRTRLTYAELDRYAGGIAARLAEHGVARGDRVALCVPRSAAGVAAILAILRRGATYVPLDLSYPHSRLAAMLAAAGARFVAGEPPPGLPLGGRTVIGIPEPHEVTAAAADRYATPDDLCYVVFTSGSTGVPKGIGLSHRALANLAQWQVRRSQSPAHTAQLTPYSFDVHFQEIFGTLAAGGTLVVGSDELRRDPQALLSWLDTHQVGRIFLPYVLLAGLADAARRAPAPRYLREVVTAGERLQVTDAVRDMFRRLPTGAVLDNHYGPAETHVVTAELLSGDPAAWPDLPLIGRPLPGVTCEVVDVCGAPAAPGTPGELLLGGVQLCGGYLGQPELSARRFAGGRYRTGDLVRWTAGGLGFLGRADDQVKIRGHRVEPAEVEAVLSGHSGVRECAVLAEPGPDGRLRLVAYVAGSPGSTLTPDAVRGWLAERLPAALVPARALVVDRLARTPSGKVDRRALPAASAPPATLPAAPAAGTLAAVLAAFESILDAPVGPDDDFFARGGDSILAIQLATALSDGGHPVTPRDVFDHPTPAGLAAVARQGPAPGGPLVATARQRGLRDAPARFAWVRRPAAPADPLALRTAVDSLVRTQPALRSRVTDVVTVVDREPHAVLVEVDLTALAPDAAEAMAEQAAARAAASLDAEHGPVFRIVWCRLPGGDRIGVAAHPSVVDAESFTALRERLLAPPDDATSDRGWLRWLAAERRRQPGPGPHRAWPRELAAAQRLLSGQDAAFIRDDAPPAARRAGTLGQWETVVYVPGGDNEDGLAAVLRRVKLALPAAESAGWPPFAEASSGEPSALDGIDPAATLTTADLPLAGLTEPELGSLVAEHGVPEDAYPATPMQRTMLAREAAGGRPGMFAVRTCHPLPPATDPVALREAFDEIVRRHPILRTSFVTSAAGSVQWVHPDAALPWLDLDWRDVTGPALRARMERFLAEDFAVPFHPGRAPLARCALIRMRGGYELVFTAHHLLMDGWSRSLLLQDLPALYAERLRRRPPRARWATATRQLAMLPAVGLGGARALLRARREAVLPETPAPFRDHVAALSAADPSPAWEHWRGYLAGGDQDGVRPPAHDAVPAGGYRRLAASVPPATVDDLAELTRTHGVTVAVAAQAAWALVLAESTAAGTVRFGVTSSGRVWGLPAYHRMVGMFITTLPRRVPVPADRTVLAVMRGIQADAARSQEAEQVALVDLERDAGGRLFDSIVVVDNFPQDAAQHALGALLRRGHPFATDHLDLGMTEFPLRLEVIPMDGLHVALCHHRDQYGGEDAELLVGRWLDLLTAIAKRPEATIGELL